MASDQTLRAIITVLDRTVEPLAQINARFSRLSAPLAHIRGQLGEIAEQAGLTRIGERAGEALEHVKRLGEGLFELLEPLAALGAVGSVVGLGEIAKSTTEFAEKLYFSSIQTGLATNAMAGWHYAAGIANIDVQQLDRGFTYLNRRISEAARGKAKDVEQLLTRMGLHNAPGHLIATADALKAVTAAAKHLVDSGQTQLATDMMSTLFGERMGARLLPLLGQGQDKIDELLGAATAHGIGLSKEQTAAALRFEETYKGLAGAVLGLKLAIGEQLFPVLGPIIDQMTRWMDANRAWLAVKVGDAVKQLGDRVRAVNFGAIVGGLEEFGHVAGAVVAAVGGIGPAVAILAGIKFAPAILAFGELGAAVAVTAAKFLVFPVAALVGSIATLIPSVRGLRDVWALLDVALDANPIGAAVAAVALLGAAAYEVYQHWQPIAAFFKRLWDGIADTFERAWRVIKPVVDALRDAVEWIGGHLGALSSSPALPGVPAGTGGGFDWSGTGAVLPPVPLSSAAFAAAAPQKSETKVTLDFKNLPSGVWPAIENKGRPDVTSNLGYAMPY